MSPNKTNEEELLECQLKLVQHYYKEDFSEEYKVSDLLISLNILDEPRVEQLKIIIPKIWIELILKNIDNIRRLIDDCETKYTDFSDILISLNRIEKEINNVKNIDIVDLEKKYDEIKDLRDNTISQLQREDFMAQLQKRKRIENLIYFIGGVILTLAFNLFITS